MSHITVTGANGFLGWHTRTALLANGFPAKALALGTNFNINTAKTTLNQSRRLIHLAGVNRGSEQEVAEGNILFAQQLADALKLTPQVPPVVVFANSIQASLGNNYGDSKLRAAEILEEAATSVGARFVNVLLPNLFGEHGRPFYNSVTATFCQLLSAGGEASIDRDKELTLLHAQNAADILIGHVSPQAQRELEVTETVSGLLGRLQEISKIYAKGEIPDISDTFDRDLFNTYRSYNFGLHTPIGLTRHADARGSFFEIVRSLGGAGQSSFSTTVPGISRGDHFHRRKIERFTVLSGEATISLRRIFTEKVYDFRVSGENPMAIDMPTGWTHKITNTGKQTLFTSFWTNEIFDPVQPDTIAEAV